MILANITVESDPKLKSSAVIDESLRIRIYHGDLKISKLKHFIFTYKVCNINLNDILQGLKEMQAQDVDCTEVITSSVITALKSLDYNKNVNIDTLNFLIKQIFLLGCNKFADRYSAETLVFASLLHSIAQQAYRFLRKATT